MITKEELTMLKSIGLLRAFKKAHFEKMSGVTISTFSGTVFAIDTDLYERLKIYLQEENVVITSDNEFSLALAKLVLFENQIDFEYDSKGYRVSLEELDYIKSLMSHISGLEWEKNNENTFS